MRNEMVHSLLEAAGAQVAGAEAAGAEAASAEAASAEAASAEAATAETARTDMSDASMKSATADVETTESVTAESAMAESATAQSAPVECAPVGASVWDVSLSELLASGDELYRRSFCESTPLVVRRAAHAEAAAFEGLTLSELADAWGDELVTVARSPDPLYHLPWPMHAPDDERALRSVPVETMGFADFVAELLAGCSVDSHPADGGPADRVDVPNGADGAAGTCASFVAVSQSHTENFASFRGLPMSGLPSALEALVSGCHGGDSGGSRIHRRNLWVCAPPKLSVLHYDADDSVLVQLSGSKTFTLVDPRPLHGLSTHPALLPICELLPTRRKASSARNEAGAEDVADEDGAAEYSADDENEADGVDGAGVARHFPLVNVTQPDLARHPLFRYARTVTVEVQAGDALILPAYWYHEVESHTKRPDQPNVAINVWFDADTRDAAGVPARLHRVLREKLRIDCTPRHSNDIQY